MADYLDELKENLRAKIENFLEDHPQAVLLDEKEKRNTCGHPEISREFLYQCLDKEGKEDNHYMIYTTYDWNRFIYCGCFIEKEGIYVFEEENKEKARKYLGQSHAPWVFALKRYHNYDCPQGIEHRTKTGTLCFELPEDYDVVCDMINRFKNTFKKE